MTTTMMMTMRMRRTRDKLMLERIYFKALWLVRISYYNTFIFVIYLLYICCIFVVYLLYICCIFVVVVASHSYLL